MRASVRALTVLLLLLVSCGVSWAQGEWDDSPAAQAVLRIGAAIGLETAGDGADPFVVLDELASSGIISASTRGAMEQAVPTETLSADLFVVFLSDVLNAQDDAPTLPVALQNLIEAGIRVPYGTLTVAHVGSYFAEPDFATALMRRYQEAASPIDPTGR